MLQGWTSYAVIVSVAPLELAAAAARAGIVAAGGAHFFVAQDLHHLGRLPSVLQQCRHDPHGTVDMGEKRLVPGAKVIQTRLAVRRLDKSVFRAFPITGETHMALAAIARQG